MKYLKSGFTLIELVIVIVLISIIALIAAPMLYEGVNATHINYTLTEQAGQGNQATIQMTRDLYNLWNVNALTLSANAISFTDSRNTTISYQLSNGNLLRNNIILAEHATQLDFTYYDVTGTVTNTASSVRYIAFSFVLNNQTMSQTLGGFVYLRNAL